MEISRFRETEVFVCLSVQISLFAMLVNIPSTVQFQLLDLNNVFMFIFMPNIIINYIIDRTSQQVVRRII